MNVALLIFHFGNMEPTIFLLERWCPLFCGPLYPSPQIPPHIKYSTPYTTPSAVPYMSHIFNHILLIYPFHFCSAAWLFFRFHIHRKVRKKLLILNKQKTGSHWPLLKEYVVCASSWFYFYRCFTLILFVAVYVDWAFKFHIYSLQDNFLVVIL